MSEWSMYTMGSDTLSSALGVHAKCSFDVPITVYLQLHGFSRQLPERFGQTAALTNQAGRHELVAQLRGSPVDMNGRLARRILHQVIRRA